MILQSEWLREHTTDMKLGYGRLFIQRGNSVRLYPEQDSSEWVPSTTWNSLELKRALGHVHDRLYNDFNAAISLARSQELRKHLRSQLIATRTVDFAMFVKVNLALRQSRM